MPGKNGDRLTGPDLSPAHRFALAAVSSIETETEAGRLWESLPMT